MRLHLCGGHESAAGLREDAGKTSAFVIITLSFFSHPLVHIKIDIVAVIITNILKLSVSLTSLARCTGGSGSGAIEHPCAQEDHAVPPRG
jgi:hypothetical protein